LTDTAPPVLIVPEDIVVNATSEQGAVVTYTVTTQDNVDGTFTLEEDGITITRDNAGVYANMDPISPMPAQNCVNQLAITCCDPVSGSIFPIGENTVECTATDSASNKATQSFTITVTPPSEDEGETAQLVQEEELPPPPPAAEEEGDEGETTDAEEQELPPPPAEGEGGTLDAEEPPPSEEEEENEGETSEE
jgi:hypothetical protein